MTGNPLGEGQTMDGNEKSLDLGSFSLVINETRDAILIPASALSLNVPNSTWKKRLKRFFRLVRLN